MVMNTKSTLTRPRILGTFTGAYRNECITNANDPDHPRNFDEEAWVYGILHMDRPFGR